VSPSPYANLKQLNSIMELVDPARFGKLADKSGMDEISCDTATLDSGKSFAVGTYRKR